MPSLSYVVCSESAIELNTNTRKRETNRKFNVKHIILVEKRETEVISSAHQNIITEFRNSLATRRRKRKKLPKSYHSSFQEDAKKKNHITVESKPTAATHTFTTYTHPHTHSKS